MSNIDDLTTVASEAKAEFNLMDRLAGRPTRTSKVTVYLDEVTGEKHAARRAELDAAKQASDDPEDYSGLAAEVQRLTDELHRSGITFHLRATPDIVNKKADRDARKFLGIKGNVPAEQLNDYADQYTARIFADTVEQWTPHETGEVKTELTIPEALALKNFLPTGQYAKLDAAVADLNFKAQIADTVTADVDF